MGTIQLSTQSLTPDQRRSHRRCQLLLVLTLLPLCWLGMMIVHEFGHIAAAWATGGRVTQVVLHPLAISRTDVEPNPAPGIVVWAGPIIGAVLPVAVWLATAGAGWSRAYLPRFFAGFCLIANGAYIGAGSFDQVGDARVMLQTESPIWTLWAFGIVCVDAGLYLWHGEGKYFGLGHHACRVDRSEAVAMAAILLAVVLFELVISSTGFDWLTHVWWSRATHGHLAFSSWYRGINLVEGTAWIVIAALVFVRYVRHRNSPLELMYSAAFVTFGLSDYREAYALQTWLILVKGVNLVALLWLRHVILRRYYPEGRTA